MTNKRNIHIAPKTYSTAQNPVILNYIGTGSDVTISYKFLTGRDANGRASVVNIDNFSVTETTLDQQQQNTLAAASINSSNWTRSWSVPNKHLYNGGGELNEQTKNYETFYRPYDPAIGRFTQVDILTAKYSSLTPYNFAFNDPITFNDPLGDDPNNWEYGPVITSNYTPTLQRGFMNQGDGDLASRYQDVQTRGLWDTNYSQMMQAKWEARNDGDVYVRDPTNREWVDAWEIILFGNSNVNLDYLSKAVTAVNNSLNKKKQSGSNGLLNSFNHQVVTFGFGQMGDAVFGIESLAGILTYLVETDGIFGNEKGLPKNISNNNQRGKPVNQNFWDQMNNGFAAMLGILRENNPDNVTEQNQQLIESPLEIDKVLIKRDTFKRYEWFKLFQNEGTDFGILNIYSDGSTDTTKVTIKTHGL